MVGKLQRKSLLGTDGRVINQNDGKIYCKGVD
jgi:hypothetical protein